MSFWGFQPYVTVAQRRARALKEIEKLRKARLAPAPVVIEGRKIAKTFWGKAWCDNLERYSDFASRLPRGRSYVNHGSVIDLRIERGRVEALVSGSALYKVRIEIPVAAPARWQAICADCSGSVGSIVELLQGKLAKHVMERVCREADGLFPAPKEIKMSCSCPDWAGMCKHVAATLYGVGARLDQEPDGLFALRGVDRSGLVSIDGDVSIATMGAQSERVLVDGDVGALFGIELDLPPPTEPKSLRQKADGVPAGRGTSGSTAPAAIRRPRANQATREPAPLPTSAKAKAAALATKAPAGSRSKRTRVAPIEAAEGAAPKRTKATAPSPRPGQLPRSTRRTAAAAPGGKTNDSAKRKDGAKRKAKPWPSPPAKDEPNARDLSPADRTRAPKWIGTKARSTTRKG